MFPTSVLCYPHRERLGSRPGASRLFMITLPFELVGPPPLVVLSMHSRVFLVFCGCCHELTF